MISLATAFTQKFILFRYNPSLLTNYDTSGSYYNLMTASKHNVAEPRVVQRPVGVAMNTKVCIEHFKKIVIYHSYRIIGKSLSIFQELFVYPVSQINRLLKSLI